MEELDSFSFEKLKKSPLRVNKEILIDEVTLDSADSGIPKRKRIFINSGNHAQSLQDLSHNKVSLKQFSSSENNLNILTGF
jgi:hypothetical protein